MCFTNLRRRQENVGETLVYILGYRSSVKYCPPCSFFCDHEEKHTKPSLPVFLSTPTCLWGILLLFVFWSSLLAHRKNRVQSSQIESDSLCKMLQRETNLSGGEYSGTSVALHESSSVKLRVRFDSIGKDSDINVPGALGLQLQYRTALMTM